MSDHLRTALVDGYEKLYGRTGDPLGKEKSLLAALQELTTTYDANSKLLEIKQGKAAIVILCISLFSRTGDAHARTCAATEDPEPQVFAGGTVSTGQKFALTFTLDMKEAYFTRNFPDKKINHIMRTELKNGKWQEPIPISFSNDQWSDLDPALSPSGRRLFFISTRPAPGVQDIKTRNMDIWYADRVGNVWGGSPSILTM